MSELLNLHMQRHEAAAYMMSLHRFIYMCSCTDGRCGFCWQGLETGVWVLGRGDIVPVVPDGIKRQYEDILMWVGNGHTG